MTARRGTGSSGGVIPSLTAQDLVKAIPSLDAIASIEASTLSSIPGASLVVSDLCRCLVWAQAQVAAGATGVVITQGTDTIEESSYFFDLYWDQEAPLVITGAMRHPESESPDGAGNLLAATIVAASPESRDRGVLVVMNNSIHSARWVQKCHSSGLSAFESKPFGAIGFVEEATPCYSAAPSKRVPHLSLPPDTNRPGVALVKVHIGEDGRLLRLAIDGGYRGAIIEAFGVGHVPAGFAKTTELLARRVPLVMTTTTGAGTTFQRTYGFEGSEIHLLQQGVIPAGWLCSRKARILLSELLSTSTDMHGIMNEFKVRGSTHY